MAGHPCSVRSEIDFATVFREKSQSSFMKEIQSSAFKNLKSSVVKCLYFLLTQNVEGSNPT